MRKVILISLAAGAAALSAAERDCEPGTYANVRERAANTLRYAHSPNWMFEKIAAGKMSVGGYVGSRDPQVCEMGGLYLQKTERVQGLVDLVAEKTRKAGKLFFSLGSFEKAKARGSAFYCGDGNDAASWRKMYAECTK